MKRLGNALSHGITGGVVAFVAVFVIALVAVALIGYAGNAQHHTQFAVGGSALQVATIMGGSFGALYFALMFLGGLASPKGACKCK